MPQQQPAADGPAALPPDATSRLCVKNLPKHLKEPRLKEHFSAKGQVTDVKILKTRDGHSRQMAFIGFRSVEDATSALRYFQNTFIDTSRLAIEYARPYRAAAAPAAAAAAPAVADAAAAAPAASGADKEHRPWSKYSVGSSKHQQLLAKQQQGPAGGAAAAAGGKADKKNSKKKGHPAADDPAAVDPKLTEFLQLMQPRMKAKIWSNDELLPGAATAPASAAAAAAAADEEADDMYVDLPAKPRQQQQQRRLAALAAAAGSGSEDEQSDDGTSSDDDDTNPLASKDAVVVDEGVSDLDYLRARMKPDLTAAAGADGDGSSDDDEGGNSSSGGSDEDDEQAAGRAAAAVARRAGGRRGLQHMDTGSDHEEDDDDGSGSGSDADVGSDEEMADADAARAAAAGDDEGPDSEQEAGEDEGGEGDEFNATTRGDQAGVGPSPAAAAGGLDAAAAAAEAEVRESGRLFVRNLAYSAGETELSELFGAYGTLEEVHLVSDRDTKRSRGIAYIKFLLPEDALAAFRALDMTAFQGRLLHILPARKRPGEEQAAAGDEQTEDGTAAKGAAGSSFKSQRAAQRKADAGNRAAWSTLFMRADTVAAAVAAHYGVSKAQLLDAAAEDLPLRMALGEAQVVAQTKAALADGGINVSALEAAAAASGAAAAKASVARSSSTLLVKNLPYSADEDELRLLFAGSGRTVVRLVLPPTRTLALVEFGEAQEARAAFKSLAYKKYHQVPLFLEWAPRDIWDTPAPAAAKPTAAKPAAAGGQQADAAAAAAAAAAGEAQQADKAAKEEAEGEEAPVACIYVKNLNFATTDAALKKHFDKAVSAAGGQIHSAKVARRKGPDGKLLSMGFGFVETDSEAAAKAAIQALQSSSLDKHKVQLQLSKRGAPGSSSPSAKAKAAAAAKAAAKSGGTKLVVRNVAFEATRKDLLGLFGPFGHIKSCRLPKKFDGHHRGFAFLEFTTQQEAANALEGVGGTHLYGRRLVVEHAQAEDVSNVDELRAKTAAKYAAGEEGQPEGPAPKRLKKNL